MKVKRYYPQLTEYDEGTRKKRRGLGGMEKGEGDKQGCREGIDIERND